MPFSFNERRQAIEHLQKEPIDILVVGGGIVGSSVAAHAVAAGFRTGLLERTDWAAGASGHSTGLAHAGLRYLSQGKLGFVFRAAAQRRELEWLAPQWVRPYEFVLPVYARDQYSFPTLRFGTWLYDTLCRLAALTSRQKPLPRYQSASAQDILDRVPGLKAEGLLGGLRYFVDAQVQDNRLTMGIAQAAARAGAWCANHAEVTAILPPPSSNEGARVKAMDRITGTSFEVSARLVINATGAWIDQVRQAAGLGGQIVRASRGTHLVVDAVTSVPLILTTRVPGKVFFVLPAFGGDASLIGTTDVGITGSPDDSRPDAKEITELLQRLFALFPYLKQGDNLQEAIRAYARLHVRSVYWAERPLLNQPGDTLGVSREHAIVKESRYVWSIPGVKLTSGWAVGRDVVNAARNTFKRPGKSKTIDSLPGGELWDYDKFVADAKRRFRLGDDSNKTIQYLVAMYGTRYVDVLQWANREPHYRERVIDSEPWILAQVAFAVHEEMALSLNDLLWRRTKWAVQRRLPEETLHAIAQEMAELLGWSTETRQAQIQSYQDEQKRRTLVL